MALAVLHAAMGFAPTREGYTLLTPEGYVARGWASWEEVNEAGPETWPTGPPADIPCIKLFTFDFDGTTEFTDNLAHAVFDHATEEEKLTDLVPAYERLKAELGGTAAIIMAYFDGPGRIEYFRKYVDELIGQESHVFILSASWDPTPGTVWEAYLYHVLKDVGIPFPPDRIVGTDDPGPGIAADKANPGMRVARMLGVPSAQVMHTDNSFKYNAQFSRSAGTGCTPLRRVRRRPSKTPSSSVC
mmetsp:Transcript_24713/g.79824  ORF Transcript_24713/g.79824 Transcript_24713/m.79824 type:complete len:244 (-) Transcript_24713:238-969(-)